MGVSVSAAELLAEAGIHAAVLDAVYLKPVDEEAVVDAATAGPVLTVEEHMPIGGVGSIVAEILGGHGIVTKLGRVAISDEAIEAGVPEELMNYYGLTPAAVARRAQDLL